MQETLPLMEFFYTIQGEGYHQGRAAYFIRLAGCDVGCHWCDVKESWDAGSHPQVAVDKMVADAADQESDIVVVTGGEPLMHDLTNLTGQLKDKGCQTHIETSGAHPLSGQWDWVTWSPKKFKNAVDGFGQFADELKIVVYNKHDFEWAETFVKDLKPGCKLYLQPEWGREPEVLPQIISYVKEHPEWRVSLQSHKYMQVP